MDRYIATKDKIYINRYNITDTCIEILNDDGEFIEYELICYCDGKIKADLLIKALETLLEVNRGSYV